MTLLAIDNLSVVRGGRVVLADVSISLPGPGVHVLLGPGGAGKSTLLHLLSGAFFDHRDIQVTGEMLVLGHPLGAGNVLPLASQRAPLLGACLLDILVEALAFRSSLTRTEQRQRIELLLRSGDRPELVAHLGSELFDLTPGQRRYALVLRTILSQQPIVALDEPTAGLSEEDAEPILALLERARVRRGVLLVTHNQRHARRLASWATLLAAGSVVESAPADAFFTAPRTDALALYLRTGGCARPSVDADPEALEEPWQSEIREMRARLVAQGVLLSPLPSGSAVATDVDTLPPVGAAALVSTDGVRSEDAAYPSVRAAAAVVPDGEMPSPPTPHRITRPLALVSESQGPRGFRWVRPGRLGGSPRPGITQEIEHDLEALARVGIGALVSLTTRPVDSALLLTYGIEGLHRPIVDMHAPTMEEAVWLCEWVNVRLRQGVAVCFHCRAGLGRTGTALAAQLIWEEGLDAGRALSAVRAAEARYVQSVVQEQFLLAFAARTRRAAGIPGDTSVSQTTSVTI